MIKGQTREHSDIWSLELITRTLHYMLFIMVRLISFTECWFRSVEKSQFGACEEILSIFGKGFQCALGSCYWSEFPIKAGQILLDEWNQILFHACALSLSVKASSVFTLSVLLFIPFLPLLAFFFYFSAEILDFKAPFSVNEKNNSTTKCKLLILTREEGFLSFIMMLMMIIIIIWKKVVKKRGFVITV